MRASPRRPCFTARGDQRPKEIDRNWRMGPKVHGSGPRDLVWNHSCMDMIRYCVLVHKGIVLFIVCFDLIGCKLPRYQAPPRHWMQDCCQHDQRKKPRRNSSNIQHRQRLYSWGTINIVKLFWLYPYTDASFTLAHLQEEAQIRKENVRTLLSVVISIAILTLLIILTGMGWGPINL